MCKDLIVEIDYETINDNKLKNLEVLSELNYILTNEDFFKILDIYSCAVDRIGGKIKG